MDPKQRRKCRSLLFPIFCGLALPLLSSTSFSEPMRYLRDFELEKAHYLEVARSTSSAIGSAVNSTSITIDSVKNQVGRVVADFVDGFTDQKLKFCDPNLPTEVEYLDDIQNFQVDVTHVPVCVILSVFNQEEHITPVLASIVNQTHQNIEVIAVDDGSSDKTKHRLADFSKKNKKVKVIRLGTHTSPGQSFNIGLLSCPSKTRYVLLNNGQTKMEKDAVASMLSYAEHLRVDVVLADFDTQLTLQGRTLVEEYSDDLSHWSSLPAGSPFNVYSEPDVLRIAPASWRKLYRHKMLVDNRIDFREGYFNSEDDFHWRVITRATRISKLDRILFHRLKATEMDEVEQGSFLRNAHHIGKMLFEQELSKKPMCLPSEATPSIAMNYFEWILLHAWISKDKEEDQIQAKLDRLLNHTIHYWPQRSKLPEAYWKPLSESLDFALLNSPTQIDLSIIIPAYNVKDLIKELLVKMYISLTKPGFSFEVFVVDDGSTDGTLDVLLKFRKDHESNFFVLKTPTSNGGAGRARNIAIPLIEGRYVYFIDADDGYDFEALVESVSFATSNGFDLLIYPYDTETVSSEKNVTVEGMMSADEKIWKDLPAEENRTLDVMKDAALGLINYPWKQLTSSRIVKDADIYFGPTVIHNDVQFHWTSIAASQNLHFYNKKVCSHRKYDSSVRGQLTAVNTSSRMAVFYSISLTQRALARQGAFDGDEREGYAFKRWLQFARDVLNWASKKIPTELELEYKQWWKHMLNTLKDESLKPSSFRTWAYWAGP